MKLFSCDYQEGACPEIIDALVRTNMDATVGYGEDEHCEAARALIREKCDCPDACVQFLVGGTQTNFTLLSAALRPYQGVLSADTGHINVHESGAVEATGHKVIALPGKDAKISGEQVDAYCRDHFADESHEHIVMPGAVYISNPTEYGTIYTPEELASLREACDKWNLYLYLDGARLGYGMAAKENRLTYPMLAKYCDAFYIGGTKQAALFGEALVITNPALAKDFRYLIKQKGAMLAKGRLLGIQFEVLMQDDLYERYSAHAVALAAEIRSALVKRGFRLYIDSPTNQQFPVVTEAQLAKLRQKYGFSVFGRDGEDYVIRFCTSWATRIEDVEELIRDIETL